MELLSAKLKLASVLAFSFALFLPAPGCERGTSKTGGSRTGATSDNVAKYTYQVQAAYPHDPGAYTQGLEFYEGSLYESTGRYGDSSLRRVDLKTGAVLQRADLPSEYFGEGMTILGGRIYQLTWKGQKGFIYDLATFAKTGEFPYTGEGWGLTNDGESLIMSDGSNTIRFLDPKTFHLKRTVSVFEGKRPLINLNELEFIRGEIFANVYQSDRMLRIDSQTGKLLGVIELGGLLDRGKYSEPVDVLNGIAYDSAGDRLFVTGKLWPALFEIKLKKR